MMLLIAQSMLLYKRGSTSNGVASGACQSPSCSTLRALTSGATVAVSTRSAASKRGSAGRFAGRWSPQRWRQDRAVLVAAAAASATGPLPLPKARPLPDVTNRDVRFILDRASKFSRQQGTIAAPVGSSHLQQCRIKPELHPVVRVAFHQKSRSRAGRSCWTASRTRSAPAHRQPAAAARRG